MFELGKIYEPLIIETLLSSQHMISVNKKFDLTLGSRVSDYLTTRGFNHKFAHQEFRLIQFMAGASPENIEKILAFRRSQGPTKEFLIRGCKLFEKKDEELRQDYLSLYKRLSRHKYAIFFEQTRFMCALHYTANNIEEAAKILSINVKDARNFILLHKLFFSCQDESENENVKENINEKMSDTVSFDEENEVSIDEFEKNLLREFSFLSSSRSSSPNWDMDSIQSEVTIRGDMFGPDCFGEDDLLLPDDDMSTSSFSNVH